MSMFSDDEDDDEIDDRFADDVLRKATSGGVYIDVDDIVDAHNWLVTHERREDADVVLNYGLDIHAGNWRLLVVKSMSLIDNAELTKAELLLDYVADDANGDSGYHISRGWLSLRKGDDKAAEEHFNDAVRVSEGDMAETTLSEICSNLVQFEKFEMAMKFFSKLSSDFINVSIPTAFEYAYTLSQTGRDDEAVQVYEHITSEDPFHDSAWYNLGILYSKDGRYDEAIDAYTACTDANPEYGEAYFNLGNIRLEQDDFLAAVGCYTSYLSLSQPEPELRVYAYLGDCWLRLENFDLASRILDFVVDRMPDYDAAWYDLGRCHLELGANEAAERDFRKAIRLKPDVACYHFAFAQAELNLGSQGEAVSALEKGLRCSPDDVLAWFELIRLTFDFSNCDYAEFHKYIDDKKLEFGSPKALLLIEAYFEFFVFRKKRAATSLMRDVAKCMPQVIKDASVEPDLSKLFEQKGIESVLDEFNIKLK